MAIDFALGPSGVEEGDSPMKTCTVRATLLLQAIAVAGVIGFAAPASVALAQDSPNAKSGRSAAASKPSSVGGVVVEAPSKRDTIPPKKKAALDAAAAKRKAMQKYRNAAPVATVGQNAGVSAEARAGNYPGLRSAAAH